MSNGGREGTLLRYPRLAALATREWPAWLWRADGSRILWANATGAAIFGADTSRACSERRFHVSDLAAAQVIRLAATLPAGEQERLERLRGFARLNRPLVCACSRVPTDHGGGRCSSPLPKRRVRRCRSPSACGGCWRPTSGRSRLFCPMAASSMPIPRARGGLAAPPA